VSRRAVLTAFFHPRRRQELSKHDSECAASIGSQSRNPSHYRWFPDRFLFFTGYPQTGTATMGRIYSRANNSGFLQVVAKSIFSRGQKTVKVFFYKVETKKKIFSNFTFRGVQSKAPRHPALNNHENEDIMYTYDKPRSSHHKLTRLPPKDSVM